MSKNERIRDKYPVIDAYGGRHEFLGTRDASETTLEGRIRSVWPFIVRRVLAFHETLKPRERVNFDPEDVLTELWLAIATKDEQWTPERGKYITFAGVIIDRELCAIRDKARTVQSPRNSSCRLKKYREEEASGTITDRRAKTAADIRRTDGGARDIGPGTDTWESQPCEPLDVMADDESRAACLDAVKSAVKQLEPFEAYVLGRLAGLWGRPPASVWLIAWETSRHQEEVRRAKDRAVLKVRKHLTAIKHPVASE